MQIFSVFICWNYLLGFRYKPFGIRHFTNMAKVIIKTVFLDKGKGFAMRKNKRFIKFGLLSIMFFAVISLTINVLAIDAKALTGEEVTEVTGGEESESRELESKELNDFSVDVITTDYTIDDTGEDENVINQFSNDDQEENSSESVFNETNEQNSNLIDNDDETTETNPSSDYVLTAVIPKSTPLLRSESPQAVDVTITNFELKTLTYETPESIYYNDTFYLAMDWDASSLGATLHEGDYFDITLPSNMMFPSGSTARDFDLYDENYNVIAKAHVNPGEGDIGGNLVVTFTDVVENKYDVKGTIYLAARFDKTQITTGETNTFSITVNGEVPSYSQTIETGIVITGPKELDNEYLAKWGQSVYNQPNQAEWWARINHTKATLSNVVINDTLGSSGETYIADSFRLRLVEFDPYGNTITSSNIDITDKLTISDDGSSFSLVLGDINGEQYQLVYKTTYTPGTVLKNSLKLDSNEYQKTYTATHVSAESGGTGGGSLASKIKIIKVDENDASIVLSNAVFRVTAPNGDTFTLTTGGDGTVTSDILTQGTYTVEEITPPAGYEIIPEESTFTMEVTSLGGAVRRVKNRPITTIDISVSKAWSDENNQDGIRPDSVTVKLLADGAETNKTVELSAENNWTGNFTDLDEYQNGQKVTYTVEEVDTTGYVSAVSGDAETGFVITNTHEVEKKSIEVNKIWNDQNNVDNIRPAEITIRLLADNIDTNKSITLNAENNWKGSFNNLDVYSGGELIHYSVVEDAVIKYKTTIAGTEDIGFTITNSYTPTSRKTPYTGDSSDRGIMLSIFAISVLVLIGSLIIKKEQM